MKFILPMPPSINQTYGVNRDKVDPLYKKKPVRDWEEEAGYMILEQNRGFKMGFKGVVEVGIDWFYKIDRDIDAGIKVLLDLLQKQRIVLNDRQIRRITHVDIKPDPKNPRVEITIDEMA
jgi:Holliday junction resolvase RusA-like endonuclease